MVPSIVTGCVIVGRAESRLIVCTPLPGMLKLIAFGPLTAFELMIAWRRLPAAAVVGVGDGECREHLPALERLDGEAPAALLEAAGRPGITTALRKARQHGSKPPRQCGRRTRSPDDPDRTGPLSVPVDGNVFLENRPSEPGWKGGFGPLAEFASIWELSSAAPVRHPKRRDHGLRGSALRIGCNVRFQ